MTKNIIVSIGIVFSLSMLTGCGLYSLSAFGSCNKWEIYSEESQISKKPKIDICASMLGYSFNSFDMKNYIEIQDMVYPKLVDLINKYPSLRTCKIKKKSIKYGFGVGGSPIGATMICQKAIKFKRTEGRFFMTSFPFSRSYSSKR